MSTTLRSVPSMWPRVDDRPLWVEILAGRRCGGTSPARTRAARDAWCGAAPDGVRATRCPRAGTPATGVIEYGGRSWRPLPGGGLVFTNWSDQRVYRRATGGEPGAADARRAPRRYADLYLPPGRDEVWAVREIDARRGTCATWWRCRSDGGPVRVIATAQHFLMNPRLSPGGGHVAWIGWDHPAMPWDGTELCVAPLGADGTAGPYEVVAGGPEESVDPGRVARRRHPVRGHRPDRLVEHAPDRPRRLPRPQPDARWRPKFGDAPLEARQHLLRARGRAAGRRVRHAGPPPPGRAGPGERRAARDRRRRRPTGPPPSRPPAGRWRRVAATPYTPLEVVAGRPRTAARTRWCRRRSRCPTATLLPDARGGDHRRRARAPLPAARRHGPRAVRDLRARRAHRRRPMMLDLEIAYFTSRGIGVAEVNYGGSTGYGRAYRERLRHQWGVVDVRDCATVARGLVEPGRADAAKIAIRGGSAGGWTSLAALVHSDVFAARRRPLRDHRPGELGGRDARLRVALPRRPDRPAARDPAALHRPLAAAARRPGVRPGLMLHGLEDAIVDAGQAGAVRRRAGPARHAVGAAHLSRASSTAGAGRRPSWPALEAELAFYGLIFGFATPEVPPLEAGRDAREERRRDLLGPDQVRHHQPGLRRAPGGRVRRRRCWPRPASSRWCSSRRRAAPTWSPGSRATPPTRCSSTATSTWCPPTRPSGGSHPFSGEIADGCVYGRGAVDMKGTCAMTLALCPRLGARAGCGPGGTSCWRSSPTRRPPASTARGYAVERAPRAVRRLHGGDQRVRRLQRRGAGEHRGLPGRRGRARHRLDEADRPRRRRATAPRPPVDNPVAELAHALSRLAAHQWPVRLTPAVAALIESLSRDHSASRIDLDRLDEEAERLGRARRRCSRAQIRNSANPTMLDAGYKVNVVPGTAEAHVDGRFLPGLPEEFLETIDRLLGPKITREFVNFGGRPVRAAGLAVLRRARRRPASPRTRPRGRCRT